MYIGEAQRHNNMTSAVKQTGNHSWRGCEPKITTETPSVVLLTVLLLKAKILQLSLKVHVLQANLPQLYYFVPLYQ